jgi:hypothetical protein
MCTAFPPREASGVPEWRRGQDMAAHDKSIAKKRRLRVSDGQAIDSIAILKNLADSILRSA